MIVVHVVITCCEGYPTRREPYRQAHLSRVTALRARGTLIGGGPSPDGRQAELFFRLASTDELAPLIAEDPYSRGAAWTGFTWRSFTAFVEPWELPGVVLDGTRRATLVEGPARDPDLAQLALVELRGAGHLRFGGLLGGAATLALMRAEDPAQAAQALVETGLWAEAELGTRGLIHVL
ncbi:MAG TPA: hypothetical protein VLA62_04860 [Solirubrobacterales bacterium]|nr:hypothetical protein [Solirubrobacterales bacterium]